jgi:hypothetical protein
MDSISHHSGRPHVTAEVTSSCNDPQRELEASARALVAADDGYVREAIDSVQWTRSGFLQRLTRSPR